MSSVFMQERIINELIHGLNRIVPVVGEKEFFYEDERGNHVPLQEFIVERFIGENEDSLAAAGQVMTQEECDRMSHSGYFGLSLLQGRFSSYFAENYRSFVAEAIDRITISPSVLKFLKAVRPRLIITTSPFGILEKHFPEYSSYYYGCEGDRDADTHGNDYIIYHLFGRAQQFSDNWVYDETSLLQFLHCLHDNDTSPSNLADYLKDRGTLFLGCDFPDWLFRFLWYSISIKRTPQFKPKLTAGYWFSTESSDIAFNHFLNEISYRPQKDVNHILETVAERVSDKGQSDEHAHNLPYDIFISHASEDDELCEKIKDELEKAKLRVWYDGGQIEDGNYFETFKKGIEESRYFMPIVTEHYMIKFMEAKLGGDIAGLVEETRFAVENQKKRYSRLTYSLPVVKSGDRMYNFELNAINLEKRFSSGPSPILPGELFYHIQFFFWNDEDCSKDTFHQYNWSKYNPNPK